MIVSAISVPEIRAAATRSGADVAECGNLLFYPRSSLVDYAVVIERLGDQRPTWHEFNQGAQDVGRAAVDGAHVDRVKPHQNGQHAEAWDVVGFVGKIIQCILQAEALHRGRGSGGRYLRAALHGMALLDGVRQLMRQELFALACAGLVLVAREKDVVLISKCARAELIAQAGGAGIVVDAHIAKIGPEARLHVTARIAGERLAAAGAAKNRRMCAGSDGGRPFAAALQLFIPCRGLLDFLVLFLLQLVVGQALHFIFLRR